jgi:SAM-dependent methyltransferase
MKQHAPSASGQAVWENAWRSHQASIGEPHQELLDALTRVVGNPAGKRILEVGAGSGGDSVAFAARGGRCVSLDFSTEALKIARERMPASGQDVDLVRADGAKLPFQDGAFDVVFSQGLLEHFVAPLPYLQEQFRILRPDGVLLVDVPQRWTLYTLWKRYLMKRGRWFAGWETEFSLGELERLMMACGGRIVGSYGYGYFPSLLLGIRHAHTFDVRRGTRWRLRSTVRTRIERSWAHLERQRTYYRYMANIGVLATKSS